MKVLVTGGAGYVGSVLIPELVKKYHVKCLDRFFFGDEFLSSKQFSEKVELIRDDIRWFDPKILSDVDVVLDLAALSNDPTSELDPDKTYDINFLGRSRVARLSKRLGVKKYVLASTASVYGNQDETLDEKSPTNPLSAYSKSTRMAELDILPLNDKDFSVTVLRFGTVYGLSPRMRFDLVVNIMTLNAIRNGKIIIYGDGKQRRPFIHVKDVAKAYQMIIESSSEIVGGEIFNVGSEEQNYEINTLAEDIGNAIGGKHIIEYEGEVDNRSYFASFKKIKDVLDFSPKYNVKDGAKEIFEALEQNKIEYSKKTITLDWYKHIMDSYKIVKELSLKDTIL